MFLPEHLQEKYEAAEKPLPVQTAEWLELRNKLSVCLSFDKRNKQVLFIVSVDQSLSSIFIDNLPDEAYAIHHCNTCEHFLDTFGCLGYVTSEGELKSALWSNLNPTHEYYKQSVIAMNRAVERGSIVRPFQNTGTTYLGTSLSQNTKHMYSHLFVYHPIPYPSKNRIDSIAQNFITVSNAIHKYPEEDICQLRSLFASKALTYSEKFEAPLEWFQKVHYSDRMNQIPLKWQLIATAPESYCHISASVLGKLLDGVARHLSPTELQKEMDHMLKPETYQRPQSTNDGNRAQFEKLLATNNYELAFYRREACLDDVPLLWSPVCVTAAPVDAILPPPAYDEKEAKSEEKASVVQKIPISVPPSYHSGAAMYEEESVFRRKMGWLAFQRDVLPKVKDLCLWIRERDNFACMTTAVYPHAPPILKWDRESQRNTLSWYLYVHGSLATNWNLPPLQWVPITGIALQPTMTDFPSEGNHVFFFLKGARHCNVTSMALFPHHLQNMWHSVRASVEEWSREHELQCVDGPVAAGVRTPRSSDWNICLRGVLNNVCGEFILDRWE